jgi:hypothetical protein
MTGVGTLVLPQFNGPFRIDRCPFLEGHRTDVTKVTVAALAIVKHLDVVEHIRCGFFTISTDAQGRDIFSEVTEIE